MNAGLKDELTNELAIKRVSLVLNKVFSLPDALYELVDYGEELKGDSTKAILVLKHDKLTVTIELDGPGAVNGRHLNWGLRIGAMSDEVFVDGARQVLIQGYLNPDLS